MTDAQTPDEARAALMRAVRMQMDIAQQHTKAVEMDVCEACEAHLNTAVREAVDRLVVAELRALRDLLYGGENDPGTTWRSARLDARIAELTGGKADD